MTKDEALKHALEKFEYMNHIDSIFHGEFDFQINAIKKALAQQAEPDYYGLTKDHLWMSITKDHYDRLKPEFRMACYTSPPPHEPLTDWEIDELSRTMVKGNKSVNWLARAIEAAVLEKQK